MSVSPTTNNNSFFIAIYLISFALFSTSTSVEGSHPFTQADSLLRIGLLQMPPNSNQLWNLQKGEEYCRTAKAQGADIALFPEMVNIGYHAVDFEKPQGMDEWKNMAIDRHGTFVQHFQQLARELDMAIVITYLEKTADLPKNSASLIDRHGDIKMTYSKVHTVDPFPMETAITPGDDFYVTDLDTRIGAVKVGIMTCYDREFPESARILMLKGAEIILTPNACTLDTMRLIQFRVRAWENALVTAMTNYAGTAEDDSYNGRSCAFYPNGEKIMMADKEARVYMVPVDMRKVREYRNWSYWGNAYRRPHKYEEIISPEVEAPFIRKDGFGRPFNRLKR